MNNDKLNEINQTIISELEKIDKEEDIKLQLYQPNKYYNNKNYGKEKEKTKE